MGLVIVGQVIVGLVIVGLVNATQSFRVEVFQSIPYDFSFDAIWMKCEFQEVLRHQNNSFVISFSIQKL